MTDPAAIAPLLNLIVRHESAGAVKAQGVSSPYDVVYGKIASQHRPPKPLPALTVAQVLDWQDSIDPLYGSEAAGAYQVMEDTLRALVTRGAVSAAALFDADTQDRIAVTLLEGRGLVRFLAGDITPESFGDQVAREWASFPVHRDQKGNKRSVKRGESYYADVEGNKASVKPQDVLEALAECLELRRPATPPTEPLEARVAALERKMAALSAALA